jgi:FkbM family methyltransferase
LQLTLGRVPEKLVVITSASSGFLLNEYSKKYYIGTLKNGLKFKVRKDSMADVNAIVETFCEQVYNKFCGNIEGKIVLDIGAFIGDTPSMFSIKGAKLVVAYEPDPVAYELALENIRLNNIKNVKLINAGICNKRGTMKIKAYARDEEITVDVLPLNEVIESIGEVDLMKMDCEGCEFPAILSLGNDVLSRVKELIIEYHDYPGPIVKKLESAGFLVKVEKPRCTPDGKPVGFLYAKRNEVRR